MVNTQQDHFIINHSSLSMSTHKAANRQYASFHIYSDKWAEITTFTIYANIYPGYEGF